MERQGEDFVSEVNINVPTPPVVDKNTGPSEREINHTPISWDQNKTPWCGGGDSWTHATHFNWAEDPRFSPGTLVPIWLVLLGTGNRSH